MLEWKFVAPFVALIAITATTEGAVAVFGAIRSRDYRRFENRNEAAIANRFPLPVLEHSQAEALYQAISVWARRSYAQVNAAQTRYHNAVVRSAACLALAFAALALGTVPLMTWPQHAGVDWSKFEQLLSWIEAWGLLGVLILFLHGRLTHRPWINRRAAAELMRQHQFLSLLFPDPDADSSTVERAFGAEAASVNALVRDGPMGGVGVRAAEYWAARRGALVRRPLGERDLSGDALALYLRRRARRQLIWFTDSKARLEAIGETRAHLLMALYVVALGLALYKHGLMLVSAHAPAWAPPGLLIITGLSAAMTAYYFNQNARSLIHRYNTQQRMIARWLAGFDAAWPFADLAATSPDAAARIGLRDRILEFEDLMIEELVDWVHITSHDAIELAP